MSCDSSSSSSSSCDSSQALFEPACLELNAELEQLHATAQPLGKGVKLLWPHELALLAQGALVNVTHPKASSVVLLAPCTPVAQGRAKLFRPVGDDELRFLVEHGVLPSTQPYQAVIRGHGGRVYADKFVDGVKKNDTHPTTVVEFDVSAELADELFKRQHKAEDGALSHGLGHAAGKTLPLFNEALATGQAQYRIVRVKRRLVKR